MNKFNLLALSFILAAGFGQSEVSAQKTFILEEKEDGFWLKSYKRGKTVGKVAVATAIGCLISRQLAKKFLETTNAAVAASLAHAADAAAARAVHDARIAAATVHDARIAAAAANTARNAADRARDARDAADRARAAADAARIAATAAARADAHSAAAAAAARAAAARAGATGDARAARAAAARAATEAARAATETRARAAADVAAADNGTAINTAVRAAAEANFYANMAAEYATSTANKSTQQSLKALALSGLKMPVQLGDGIVLAIKKLKGGETVCNVADRGTDFVIDNTVAGCEFVRANGAKASAKALAGAAWATPDKVKDGWKRLKRMAQGLKDGWDADADTDVDVDVDVDEAY